MQTSWLTRIIPVTGTLLITVTAIELLSRWSGDSTLAALFGTIRIVLLSCFVVWMLVQPLGLSDR